LVVVVVVVVVVGDGSGSSKIACFINTLKVVDKKGGGGSIVCTFDVCRGAGVKINVVAVPKGPRVAAAAAEARPREGVQQRARHRDEGVGRAPPRLPRRPLALERPRRLRPRAVAPRAAVRAAPRRRIAARRKSDQVSHQTDAWQKVKGRGSGMGGGSESGKQAIASAAFARQHTRNSHSATKMRKQQ
jgi:hypothetical protein